MRTVIACVQRATRFYTAGLLSLYPTPSSFSWKEQFAARLRGPIADSDSRPGIFLVRLGKGLMSLVGEMVWRGRAGERRHSKVCADRCAEATLDEQCTARHARIHTQTSHFS